MSDLKIQHILTLSYLLSKGAKHNFVTLTTSDLGKNIKKSQQAASKHLLELEKDGFIERILNGRNVSVKITPQGYSEIAKLSVILNQSMTSSPSVIELKGKIISGMGEGAYYMALKGYTKQFVEKIGYVPFPGTLNVKLERKEFTEAVRQLDSFEGKLIKGFSDGKRTYGWVKCFSAKINSVDCQLIRLERTHHDTSVIELISKKNIRKISKLNDNSKVSVIVSVNGK